MARILQLNQQVVFVGSVTDASNLIFLQAQNIRVVINCTSECPNVYENKEEIAYLQLKVPEGSCDLSAAIDETIEFLRKHRQYNIMVHSQFGFIRSNGLMICLLHRLSGIGMKQIELYMQVKRPEMNLSEEMLEFMEKYENQIVQVQNDEYLEQTRISVRSQLEHELKGVFKCKQCRQVTFTLADLEHGLKSVCTNLYVGRPTHIGADEMDGKLQCLKCKAKLGDFKLIGSKCNCGVYVAPSYIYGKSKIDKAQIV